MLCNNNELKLTINFNEKISLTDFELFLHTNNQDNYSTPKEILINLKYKTNNAKVLWENTRDLYKYESIYMNSSLWLVLNDIKFNINIYETINKMIYYKNLTELEKINELILMLTLSFISNWGDTTYYKEVLYKIENNLFIMDNNFNYKNIHYMSNDLYILLYKLDHLRILRKRSINLWELLKKEIIIIIIKF